MNETHTVADPFLCKNVEVSSRLVDRLRGRYACGPVTPGGEPEFGWRQFDTPPIQHEAAARIELLEFVVEQLFLGLMKIRTMQGDPIQVAREAMDRADAGPAHK